MTAARKLLSELVSRHPDWPARMLARSAYSMMPEAWRDLEACRTEVRKILGLKGKESRATAIFPRNLRQAGDDWRKYIPKPKRTIDDWGPVQLDGASRNLVISDTHFPYHDRVALSLAIRYGQKEKATRVIINGDWADHYADSHWQTDPRERDFADEIKQGRSGLQGIRVAFPNSEIIYKAGNHDERWEKFLMVKAPELLGLEQFSYQSIYGLDELGIRFVSDMRPIRVGKLNILHGHEYRYSIQNPVNPARGLFLRAGCHSLCGHFHQTSQHSKPTLEDHLVSCWSTGCLCELHPRYMPLNNWNLGFAFVTTNKSGAFRVDNMRIIDGKVW